MPPSIDIQLFRVEIEQLFAEGYTLKDWGLTRQGAIETTLDTISNLFHTTTDNDEAISHTIVTQGTIVSAR
jgi:hypothetical protein